MARHVPIVRLVRALAAVPLVPAKLDKDDLEEFAQQS